MNIKIKRLKKEAVIPQYAKNGDAGMDLTAISDGIQVGDILTYHTGLAMEIPEGYVGLLFPRSSVYKQDLNLTNSVGVIDSGYRGEIMFKYRLTYDGGTDLTYKKGDRIGQIIILPYPNIDFVETNILSNTNRGTGGYGSTGK